MYPENNLPLIPETKKENMEKAFISDFEHLLKEAIMKNVWFDVQYC